MTDQRALLLPRSAVWNRETIEKQIQATRNVIGDQADNSNASLRQLNEALNDTSPLLAILPIDVSRAIEAEASRLFIYPKQFVLGAVCAAWRRIIWGQVSFWRCLDLSFQGTRSTTPTRCQLLQEWLDRSAHAGLFLRLGNFANSQEEPLGFYEVLFTTTTRWEYLSIFGRPFDHFRKEIFRRKLEFPSLYGLNLTNWVFDTTNPWTFRCALLREIDMSSNGMEHYNLDWTLLKEVVLDLPGDDALYIMKAASSGLQSARLDPRTGYNIPKDGPYLFPNLAYLDLSADPDGNPSEDQIFNHWHSSLLQSLTLPALQRLALTSFSSLNVEPDNYTPSLISMIRRSQCHLKELSIVQGQASTVTERDLIQVLHHTPSLTNLDLDFVSSGSFSDALLDFLTVSGPSSSDTNTPAALPNLLSFCYMGILSCSTEALTSMLLSRLCDNRQPILTEGASNYDDGSDKSAVVKMQNFQVRYLYDSTLTRDGAFLSREFMAEAFQVDIRAQLDGGPLFVFEPC